MAKKRIFQLGLEPQYIAHVARLWMDGQFETEGLVVIDQLAKTIRIPHINVKEVNA